MAKSMKKLLVEWHERHSNGLFRGLTVDDCKDDIGLKYSAWSAGFAEGGVQIEANSTEGRIYVFRTKGDPFNNSKFYTFKIYKVFQAALEVVYHTFEKYEHKYTYFAEYADVLEMILNVFPADEIKKHKAK